MKKIIMILIFLFSYLPACTSAVISGSATTDGRPLLWKHRDTGSLENKLVYVNTPAYDFMGVANVKDSLNREIWMGINETGFSIMNTASYNINEGVSCDVEDDQEGLFMREALEKCSDIKDFELLLKASSGKWGIAANFGVIDAEGNAAYFETGYYDYKKYDVNDPETAPNGYLIRTNFSVSGGSEKGVGYIRYEATHDLFRDQERFSPEFLVKEATRNLEHGALKTHIGNMRLPRKFGNETLVSFQDYIVRYWSASVLIIQGVRPDEDPRNSIMWPIMGFPLTAMVTPVFFRTGEQLPGVITTDDDTTPFMASSALRLKAGLFPLEHDDHENYLDVAKLKNRRRTGYLQVIMKKENEILRKFNEVRETGDTEAVTDYYNWLDAYVREVYEEILSEQ